jgi:hypothetical protein
MTLRSPEPLAKQSVPAALLFISNGERVALALVSPLPLIFSTRSAGIGRPPIWLASVHSVLDAFHTVSNNELYVAFGHSSLPIYL